MTNIKQTPDKLLRRLRYFIEEEFNGNISLFSKWLDIPPTTIRGYFFRNSWPNSIVFVKMKGKMPDINLNFFFDDNEQSDYRVDRVTFKMDSQSIDPKRKVLENQYMQGQRALLKLMSENRS